MLLSTLLLFSGCGSPSGTSGLPTATLRPTASHPATPYPVIPIPENIFYQGFSESESMSDISFYIETATASTGLNAASYRGLLEQAGWTSCTGVDCDFVQVTDTNFIGQYQYGDTGDRPMLVIGVNAMITEGEQVTLFVKNCGKLIETKDASAYAFLGCRILLPTDQPDPPTPFPSSLPTVDISALDRTPIPITPLTISAENASALEESLNLNAVGDALAFSQDSMLVAANTQQGLTIWDLTSGQKKITFRDYEWSLEDIVFSPDGQTLATAEADYTIRIWDYTTGELRTTLTAPEAPDGAYTWFQNVVYGADGSWIAGGAQHGKVYIWDTKTGELLKTIDSYFSNPSLSPDGERLVAIFGGNARIWDVKTGNALYSPNIGPSNMVDSVAFAPNGSILALGMRVGNQEDHHIWLWDTQTDQMIRTFSGPENLVTTLEFNRQGDIIVAGSWDRLIYLWDVDSGELLTTLTGHSDDITRVVFAPNGQILASASRDGNIRLWRVKNP
jgi:WD40 repeat protein